MSYDAIAVAIAYADARARREGTRYTVYHVAHDWWGRDAVFYVRTDFEGPPPNEPNYETVYIAEGTNHSKDVVEYKLRTASDI